MKVITKSARVRLKEASPPLCWILTTLSGAEGWTVEFPERGSPLVITSINDSRHGPNSRHFTNEALDLRSKSFASRASKRRFREDLEAALNDHLHDPGKFRVLLEDLGKPNEHFHVQVRRGARFLNYHA